MSIEYKVIGKNIRAARKHKQMTQEAVAEAIDMSCAHFGKVERGERPVNLSRLAQICILLDVPIEALVEGSVVRSDNATPYHAHRVQESAGFLASMGDIAKGCSEASLRLMLQLCADVAHADKTK